MNDIKMHSCWIGVGSNLNDPYHQVERGIEALTELSQCEIKVSSLYETAPIGITRQPNFINAVIKIETNLQPEKLLEKLREIEKSMGRKGGIKWGPRVIDFDILVYGQEVIEHSGLKVPHPRMKNRGFVLVPLNEISPDLVLPCGSKVADLLKACEQKGVEKVAAKEEFCELV